MESAYPSPNCAVVVGTSAGGIAALREFVSHLPASFSAPVCVVMHIPPYRSSALRDILQRHGPLRVRQPDDGEALERGVIYVAPPDLHLMIWDGKVRLGTGPRENHTRPSVDPLFRSAALAFGPRAIGIVLTGLLGDGTAGMLAIRRRGGLTVVQDPSDAPYPDMPESVLRAMPVDFAGTPAAIAGFVATKVGQERLVEGESGMDEHLRMETEIALGSDVSREALDGVPPSVYSCPDCSGVLWRIDDGEVQRYRCRTGHAYSEDALFLSQSANLEGALWAAVRALSENAELVERLTKRARERGDEITARRYDARHGNLMASIAVIRDAIASDGRSEAGTTAAG